MADEGLPQLFNQRQLVARLYDLFYSSSTISLAKILYVSVPCLKKIYSLLKVDYAPRNLSV